MHPASLPEDELMKGCRVSRSKSGGPGGQRRNKVETAVELTHVESGISAHADERRSPEDNKRVALTRLRLRLALEIRQGVPIGDARSALWKSRTAAGDSGGRIVCNPKHHDYPALLAEALDMIEACKADHARAALRLDVTASSLLKLVKEHRPALVLVNRWREERGLHALK